METSEEVRNKELERHSWAEMVEEDRHRDLDRDGGKYGHSYAELEISERDNGKGGSENVVKRKESPEKVKESIGLDTDDISENAPRTVEGKKGDSRGETTKGQQESGKERREQQAEGGSDRNNNMPSSPRRGQSYADAAKVRNGKVDGEKEKWSVSNDRKVREKEACVSVLCEARISEIINGVKKAIEKTEDVSRAICAVKPDGKGRWKVLCGTASAKKSLVQMKQFRVGGQWAVVEEENKGKQLYVEPDSLFVKSEEVSQAIEQRGRVLKIEPVKVQGIWIGQWRVWTEWDPKMAVTHINGKDFRMKVEDRMHYAEQRAKQDRKQEQEVEEAQEVDGKKQASQEAEGKKQVTKEGGKQQGEEKEEEKNKAEEQGKKDKPQKHLREDPTDAVSPLSKSPPPKKQAIEEGGREGKKQGNTQALLTDFLREDEEVSDREEGSTESEEEKISPSKKKKKKKKGKYK